MANYKQDKVSGYQRSNGGTFTNPLGGIPSVTFNEEILVDVGGEKFTRPCSSVTVELTDPAKPLTLLNPATDEVIGTATLQDVFVLMYSLYRQTSDERDEAAAAGAGA